MATAIGQSLYRARQQQVLFSFDSAYSAKCLSASSLEKFSVGYTTSEFHYTLYYYDMAGNLVKTVPPKGTRPNFSAAFIKSVDSSRAIGAVDTPQHVFSTRYCYNSLNSVIAQRTPDAGVSHFWYDRLGRLVVSQNAQQTRDGNYSYTVYDPLSRIIEVGQTPQGTAMTQATSQDSTALATWMGATTSNRNQVTYTAYDQPAWTMSPLMTQNNLRNRVSYTYTKNHATDGTFYTASYYTYDVHGNVDTLIQDYLGVSPMSATPYKRICYDYDLVSGKVNGVDYQPGNSDAFYYRYQYDAENRLTNVLTSRDSITWEQDASYVYYKHGPLSRTVLGQLQAQGIDYSYTLQGWLKGTNIGNGFGAAVVDSSGSFCSPGSALSDVVVASRSVTDTPYTYIARSSITFENGFETYDGDSLQTNVNDSLTACNLPASGGDTASASGLSEAYPVAQDAYSYSLHYYPGDYNAIGATTPVTDVLTMLGSQAIPMYNGNIAASAVILPGGLRPQVYSYQYDQLNRLVQMKVDTGLNAATHTFTPVSLPDYGERVAYDPNGNINGYVRHGYGANIPMDSLTYHYYANTNQLQRINDSAGGSYTTDLKDQGTGNNYTYDLNGQLKQDLRDSVTAIDWTVYGKIDTIVNDRGTITYTYDAAGNRITKAAGGTNSIYVRDAQGNILAIYTQSRSGAPLQTEVDLYGSSRLGTVGPLTVAPTSLALSGSYGTAWLNTFTRGEKSYELTNQLGNVLSTITDKKIAVSSGGSSLIDHFTADVATAQDYYPFGMLMPGRTFNSGNYKYGLNGQMKSPEIDVNGNHTTAQFWEYDSRIGRRWNGDLIHKNSPYEVFASNPISLADPMGADTIRITRTKIIDHIKGENNGGHSDALSTPERTITRTNVDFDIKRSAGKDVFIFQENIFSTDENGNQSSTVGKPVTLDIDDLSSTHLGIAQGQYPIMDGLLGLGTENLNDRRAVAHFMDMDANFASYMLGHNPEAQRLQDEEGSLTVMNGLMPAAVSGGMGAYSAWRFTPLPSSRFYSAAYRVELPSHLYPGGTYYGHFKAANAALDAAMTADKTFAAQMESLGVEIPRRASGAIDGVSPSGWVWHHTPEPGVLDLVPKYQHPSDFSGNFWDVMHPFGAGGMSLWNK